MRRFLVNIWPDARLHLLLVFGFQYLSTIFSRTRKIFPIECHRVQAGTRALTRTRTRPLTRKRTLLDKLNGMDVHHRLSIFVRKEVQYCTSLLHSSSILFSVFWFVFIICSQQSVCFVDMCTLLLTGARIGREVPEDRRVCRTSPSLGKA